MPCDCLKCFLGWNKTNSRALKGVSKVKSIQLNKLPRLYFNFQGYRGKHRLHIDVLYTCITFLSLYSGFTSYSQVCTKIIITWKKALKYEKNIYNITYICIFFFAITYINLTQGYYLNCIKGSCTLSKYIYVYLHIYTHYTYKQCTNV